jgi:hypothetical protein
MNGDENRIEKSSCSLKSRMGDTNENKADSPMYVLISLILFKPLKSLRLRLPMLIPRMANEMIRKENV